MQRVGTCSICGGDVVGERGAWMGVNPPPPDTCRRCGATASSDVIKMYPRPGQIYGQRPRRVVRSGEGPGHKATKLS